MNTLSRWNPLRELEDFQSRILSAFRPAVSRDEKGRESFGSEWSPLVNIAEDESEYLITAELPEVNKEDVKVTVENGVLAIKGKRQFQNEEKTKKYHLVERSYGSFERVFSLPTDGDPGKVNAEFKDGILKVHVAKSEKARPKQIEVKMG
jgi:HSP20 family protein